MKGELFGKRSAWGPPNLIFLDSGRSVVPKRPMYWHEGARTTVQGYRSIVSSAYRSPTVVAPFEAAPSGAKMTFRENLRRGVASTVRSSHVPGWQRGRRRTGRRPVARRCWTEPHCLVKLWCGIVVHVFFLSQPRVSAPQWVDRLPVLYAEWPRRSQAGVRWAASGRLLTWASSCPIPALMLLFPREGTRIAPVLSEPL